MASSNPASSKCHLEGGSKSEEGDGGEHNQPRFDIGVHNQPRFDIGEHNQPRFDMDDQPDSPLSEIDLGVNSTESNQAAEPIISPPTSPVPPDRNENDRRFAKEVSTNMDNALDALKELNPMFENLIKQATTLQELDGLIKVPQEWTEMLQGQSPSTQNPTPPQTSNQLSICDHGNREAPAIKMLPANSQPSHTQPSIAGISSSSSTTMMNRPSSSKELESNQPHLTQSHSGISPSNGPPRNNIQSQSSNTSTTRLNQKVTPTCSQPLNDTDIQQPNLDTWKVTSSSGPVLKLRRKQIPQNDEMSTNSTAPVPDSSSATNKRKLSIESVNSWLKENKGKGPVKGKKSLQETQEQLDITQESEFKVRQIQQPQVRRNMQQARRPTATARTRSNTSSAEKQVRLTLRDSGSIVKPTNTSTKLRPGNGDLSPSSRSNVEIQGLHNNAQKGTPNQPVISDVPSTSADLNEEWTEMDIGLEAYRLVSHSGVPMYSSQISNAEKGIRRAWQKQQENGQAPQPTASASTFTFRLSDRKRFAMDDAKQKELALQEAEQTGASEDAVRRCRAASLKARWKADQLVAEEGRRKARAAQEEAKWKETYEKNRLAAEEAWQKALDETFALDEVSQKELTAQEEAKQKESRENAAKKKRLAAQESRQNGLVVEESWEKAFAVEEARHKTPAETFAAVEANQKALTSKETKQKAASKIAAKIMSSLEAKRKAKKRRLSAEEARQKILAEQDANQKAGSENAAKKHRLSAQNARLTDKEERQKEVLAYFADMKRQKALKIEANHTMSTAWEEARWKVLADQDEKQKANIENEAKKGRRQKVLSAQKAARQKELPSHNKRPTPDQTFVNAPKQTGQPCGSQTMPSTLRKWTPPVPISTGRGRNDNKLPMHWKTSSVPENHTKSTSFDTSPTSSLPSQNKRPTPDQTFVNALKQTGQPCGSQTLPSTPKKQTPLVSSSTGHGLHDKKLPKHWKTSSAPEKKRPIEDMNEAAESFHRANQIQQNEDKQHVGAGPWLSSNNTHDLNTTIQPTGVVHGQIDPRQATRDHTMGEADKYIQRNDGNRQHVAGPKSSTNNTHELNTIIQPTEDVRGQIDPRPAARDQAMGENTPVADKPTTSQSDSSILESMREEFICAICTEELEEPKDLNCSHSFCRNCLQDWLKSKGMLASIQCPVCLQDTPLPDKGIDGLKTNFITRNLARRIRHARLQNEQQLETEASSERGPSLEAVTTMLLDKRKELDRNLGMLKQRRDNWKQCVQTGLRDVDRYGTLLMNQIERDMLTKKVDIETENERQLKMFAAHEQEIKQMMDEIHTYTEKDAFDDKNGAVQLCNKEVPCVGAGNIRFVSSDLHLRKQLVGRVIKHGLNE